MLSRVEKYSKKEKREKKVGIDIIIIVSIALISLAVYLFSIGYWMNMLESTAFGSIIDTVIIIKVSLTALFICVCYLRYQWLLLLYRLISKTLLIVWVVFSVHMTMTGQLDHYLWLFIVAYLMIYFDILIHVNEYIQSFHQFQSKKASWWNDSNVKKVSVPSIILCLSIINIIAIYITF